MMNSKSFSTGIQTPQIFHHLPLISHKNPPHLTSFNTPFKTPSISLKTCLPPPKATATAATGGVGGGAGGGVCTQTPPEETLYDLLGISQGGTLCEIKQAYKRMALKYHPDVSPADHAGEYTARFIRVREAYETLSDPESRAVYDCNLAKGLHLAFSGGSRFAGRWRESWEVQVEELRRRSTVVEKGGRMSWAARIRKQRAGSDLDDQDGSV
ncbi:hypothetical protein SSX86_022281 [Deinandra increscens subsp. villosa]|uniref:J domain-containing protein n=1 Tax=Deinandra increscens subsp. villosa TaxID=3103831 RepID=A0AAP0CIR4_9ASTR